MMKKIYETPEVSLTFDDVEVQLCGSSLNPSQPTTGTGDLNNGGDDPGDFGRSHIGFWDED